MKPEPVNLPTIDQLIVLTFRLMAAQFCVGVILAVPLSLLFFALKAAGG